MRRSYASAVLAVVILSVCPSVWRTRALWKTKRCTVDILIPHEKAVTLVFWHRLWLANDAPSVWNLRSKWPTPFEKRRLRQISAYNASIVRDGEKRLIMTNRKSTAGFPTSYIMKDGVRTLPLSPQYSLTHTHTLPVIRLLYWSMRRAVSLP